MSGNVEIDAAERWGSTGRTCLLEESRKRTQQVHVQIFAEQMESMRWKKLGEEKRTTVVRKRERWRKIKGEEERGAEG